MRPTDAAALEARSRRAREHLERFLRAFTAGRREEARALTALGFSWFGRRLGASDWSGVLEHAFDAGPELSFGNLRPVPAEMIAALSDGPGLFDGALPAAAQVLLADVRKAERWVTIGAVLEADRRQVTLLRVFDPLPLKEALARLG